MKKIHSILLATLFLIFGIISCAIHRTNTLHIGNWAESALDFSESISFQEENDLLGIITTEKWCCGTAEKYNWLRKEENLLMTFNILKELGLKRVLSDAQYREKLFEDEYWNYHWEGLSLNEIVLKMISTYDQSIDTSDYYYKFWERRKIEKNDVAVLKILEDTDQIYNLQEASNTNNSKYLPELYQLIKYNIELNENNNAEKNKIALLYFNYLKEIGLEHSAYNLIFELKNTENLALNRDSILQTLSFDTISEDNYWQTRNNAQWIKTYRGNGP